MKILFFTHDLTQSNAHLMPWRVLCEVVSRLQHQGIEARLVSLGHEECQYSNNEIPRNTVGIIKDTQQLKAKLRLVLEEYSPDVLFFPLSFREPPERIHIVASFGIPIAGYLPGGLYSLRSAFYALYRLPISTALPYVFEALAPKGRRLRLWQDSGIRMLIALSDFTLRGIIGAGWPAEKINKIYPGRDLKSRGAAPCAIPEKAQRWLCGRPYYLFMGPPSAIRGCFDLLQAFDRAAQKDETITLICLFRSDGELETAKIKEKIQALHHASRIYPIWQSVDKEALEAYQNGCHALVMPFVIVPSEIPLTFIELLQWKKPVVTTTCDGTGEFAEKFGLAATTGSRRALAAAICSLLWDTGLYEEKSAAAGALYDAHPDWNVVASCWANVAKRCVKHS